MIKKIIKAQKTSYRIKTGIAAIAIAAVCILSPTHILPSLASEASYNTTGQSQAGTTLNPTPLSFGNAGIQTQIQLTMSSGIYRYEYIYEVSKANSNSSAVPSAMITFGDNTYSATYGNSATQSEGSPVTVRKGADLDSPVQGNDQSLLKELVIYVDADLAKKVDSSFSGAASITLSNSNSSSMIMFVPTSVPKDWKNIADGDESHLYPVTDSFYYYINPLVSGYTVDNLVTIESQGLKDDKLPTAAPPKKPKPDYTKMYVMLGGLAAFITALIVFASVSSSKKKKQRRAEERKAKRKARREKEVEDIRNSEDLESVLLEEDYSDDDYKDNADYSGDEDNNDIRTEEVTTENTPATSIDNEATTGITEIKNNAPAGSSITSFASEKKNADSRADDITGHTATASRKDDYRHTASVQQKTAPSFASVNLNHIAEDNSRGRGNAPEKMPDSHSPREEKPSVDTIGTAGPARKTTFGMPTFLQSNNQ